MGLLLYLHGLLAELVLFLRTGKCHIRAIGVCLVSASMKHEVRKKQQTISVDTAMHLNV